MVFLKIFFQNKKINIKVMDLFQKQTEKKYIQNQNKRKKNKEDQTDIIIQKSDKKQDEKTTTTQN